jgi:hypothetical protein
LNKFDKAAVFAEIEVYDAAFFSVKGAHGFVVMCLLA